MPQLGYCCNPLPFGWEGVPSQDPVSCVCRLEFNVEGTQHLFVSTPASYLPLLLVKDQEKLQAYSPYLLTDELEVHPVKYNGYCSALIMSF